MKKTIKVYNKGKEVNKEINYIPVRYIFAILITLIEIIAVIGIVFILAIYIPYFYIAIYLTAIGVIVSIVASNDNPDYKVPWVIFVICVPIVGFMCYFLFYQRKLQKKFSKRLKKIDNSLNYNDRVNFSDLQKENKLISTQANLLCNISNSHLYRNTLVKYYEIGEAMHKDILFELKKAEKFIFVEFFIIEEGKFWNSILEILKEKSKLGVEVKVLYDDIGCMSTLPGNYHKLLKQFNIDAVPFSRLKGQADSEFNNRNHRKILVIDGKVAFSGGVNVADEYINEVKRFGHWKDTAIKLVGEAVRELTKLFLTDFYINIKKEPEIKFEDYYINYTVKNSSYIIPFGDGPNPIYEKNVGKTAIMNILNQAKEYVYITTPYLIIDNELMRSIENASLRGVDVRIIIPHIPDKKLVFELTRGNSEILMKSNVKIYEYEPGFIHAKSYLADDSIGIIGTINLDYRSLTHHFENGVWIYNDESLKNLKSDFINTMSLSIYVNEENRKVSFIKRVMRSILRIFAPLL